MNIWNWIKGKIKDIYCNFKDLTFKLTRCKYILFDDMNFDYAYILANEKLKLQHTLWHYEEVCYWIDAKDIISDIKRCIELLDLMDNEYDEDVYTEYLDEYHDIRKKRMQYWWD